MRNRPESTAMIIGIVLIFAAAIGGSITLDTIRNPLPQSAEVWTENTEAVMFHVQAGVSMGVWVGEGHDWSCSIWDWNADKIPLSTSGFASQTMNGLTLVATFAVPVDGTYRFICDTSGDPMYVTIAPEHESSGLPTGVIVGIVLSSVGGIAGLTILIVTLVHEISRSKHYPSAGSF